MTHCKQCNAQIGDVASCVVAPLCDKCAIVQLRAELEKAKASLPPTFYASEALPGRIRYMNEQWNKAVTANQQLEATLDLRGRQLACVVSDMDLVEENDKLHTTLEQSKADNARLAAEIDALNNRLTAYARDNATICYQCGKPLTK